MKIVNTILIFICSLTLTACDDASKVKLKKVENPLAAYVDALDKAKDAQTMVDDALKAQRESIEKMTQ